MRQVPMTYLDPTQTHLNHTIHLAAQADDSRPDEVAAANQAALDAAWHEYHTAVTDEQKNAAMRKINAIRAIIAGSLYSGRLGKS